MERIIFILSYEKRWDCWMVYANRAIDAGDFFQSIGRYIGDEDLVEQAFNVRLKDHEAFLPKVMSRKKQVVPMLSALWG